jgi:Fe-S cluster assembly protein SufD
MNAAADSKDAAARYGRILQERLSTAPNAGTPDWLRERQRHAAARLQLTEFPDARAEDWRYTPLQGLLGRDYRADSKDFAALTLDDIDELLLRTTDHCRLVFVNGRFAPRLSCLEQVGPGLRVGSLRDALERDDGALASAPGLAVEPDAHAFETLNAALFEDGAHLHVHTGEQMGGPVEILFVTVGLDEPAMHHPRNLVTLGEGASAMLVERYAALGTSRYLTNSTTEVVLAPNARLQHVRVQEESVAAHHMGRTRLRQAAGSHYAGVTVALGGAWSRSEHRVEFSAPGAAFELDGLYLAGDGQFVDHHIDIRHSVPGCRSRETFKGLLYGAGRAVFDGRIVVEKDAQKTVAALNNANLLLSRNAEVDAKPQLEIYADDVKCSHGAAVGQIQPAELFYLRSRGIPEAQARQMLCIGFAKEVIDACGLPELRERLEAAVARQLVPAEPAE